MNRNSFTAGSTVPRDRRLIFVYGSLKRGYALSGLLQDQVFVGPAITLPLYRLFDLGSYPGLVEWPEGRCIAGELYRVAPDCLIRLDEAEGVKEGHYARRAVHLQSLPDGDPCEAWFWLGSVRQCRDCGESWP